MDSKQQTVADKTCQNDAQAQAQPQQGSTVLGASLNFVNCIVGAGCIGFGGAMASSGGIVSIVMMMFFSYLAKVSFDLIIDLTLMQSSSLDHHASYESLGFRAFGTGGRLAVVICKGCYTFLSLVAYIVIVRDNFASAMSHLFQIEPSHSAKLQVLLFDEIWSTTLLCTTIMLPICLLRELRFLESFSAVKIATFGLIIVTEAYLFWTIPSSDSTTPTSSWKEHWLEVRPGCIESMGTFVFTFIAQHTVHIVFASLQSNLQNSTSWHQVSTISVLLSFMICFPVGLFVYMTFWENTTSNLFEAYPPSKTVDMIRLLLCVTMLLTYPPSLFSFRQLVLDTCCLIPTKSTTTTTTLQSDNDPTESDWLLLPTTVPSSTIDDRDLSLYQHVLVTVLVWVSSLILALTAPSLGDVLNLCGCAFGTAIAFILPAIFSYRLKGYTMTATVLLIVGGVVGILGTWQSFVQLIRDL